MGCDFYIYKSLKVYYKDNSFDFMDIEKERGYFYFPEIDNDNIEYEKKRSEIISEQLQPRIKPIIIYQNNSFINVNYESKYKEFIFIKLVSYNKTWEDIMNIEKIEYRCERD
jgi:hypothetical protein